MNSCKCKQDCIACGNKNLISDVGISAVLAIATFQGAKINAEINLKYVEDKEFLKKSIYILDSIEEKVKILGDKIYKEVVRTIESK